MLKSCDPEIKPPYYVSPKYDGVRGIAVVKNGAVSLFSRYGHHFSRLENIEADLRGIASVSGAQSLVLDGELYIRKDELLRSEPKLTAEAVGSTTYPFTLSAAMGLRKRVDSTRPTWRVHLLHYYVFDIVAMRSGEGCHIVVPNLTPFDKRYLQLQDLFSNGPKTKHVHCVPYTTTDDLSTVRSEHIRRYLEKGYEGAVVRSSGNIYKTWPSKRANGAATVVCKHQDYDEEVKVDKTKGPRSSSVAKLVPCLDDEYQVLSLQHDRGGLVNALKCVSARGFPFNVDCRKLPLPRRQLLSFFAGKFTSVVGVFVTLQYPSVHVKSGIPRFPVIKCIRGAAGWFL